MFVNRKEVAQFFAAQMQRFGYEGKALQWQIGFNAGIEAVVHKLHQSLTFCKNDYVAKRSLFIHKATGQTYLAICDANTQTSLGHGAMRVMMHITSGDVITVNEADFESEFGTGPGAS